MLLFLGRRCCELRTPLVTESDRKNVATNDLNTAEVFASYMSFDFFFLHNTLLMLRRPENPWFQHIPE